MIERYFLKLKSNLIQRLQVLFHIGEFLWNKYIFLTLNSALRRMRYIWCLSNCKEWLWCYLESNIWEKSPLALIFNESCLRFTLVERAYFSYLSLSYKIIEPAVAFNVNGRGNTVLARYYTSNRNFAVLAVLATERYLFLSLTWDLRCRVDRSLKFLHINSAINAATNKNLVLPKSHCCNLPWMLFQERPLYT